MATTAKAIKVGRVDEGRQIPHPKPKCLSTYVEIAGGVTRLDKSRGAAICGEQEFIFYVVNYFTTE